MTDPTYPIELKLGDILQVGDQSRPYRSEDEKDWREIHPSAAGFPISNYSATVSFRRPGPPRIHVPQRGELCGTCNSVGSVLCPVCSVDGQYVGDAECDECYGDPEGVPCDCADGVRSYAERGQATNEDFRTWRNHLDACERCRTQPFNLCEVGLPILKKAANL